MGLTCPPEYRLNDFKFDLQRFDADTWDGTASTVPDAVDNVITINTAEQFVALAVAVNGGTNYSGVTIKLDVDLDLNGHNWTPNGNYSKPFKGTFNGNGKTISGLTITGSGEYVGLFGCIESATVQNITLTDPQVSGGYAVGAVVGLSKNSTVSGCHVNGTIQGVKSSSNPYFIGGVVGYNQSNAITENCTFNGTVNGGDGKDTLSGGTGNDIFIYKPNEGSDTIMDYKAGDILQILKADGSAGGSFTSSSFKSNNLTLAISGGGKVIFSDVSATDSFNINGTIHTISGKKLK